MAVANTMTSPRACGVHPYSQDQVLALLYFAELIKAEYRALRALNTVYTDRNSTRKSLRYELSSQSSPHASKFTEVALSCSSTSTKSLASNPFRNFLQSVTK